MVEDFWLTDSFYLKCKNTFYKIFNRTHFLPKTSIRQRDWLKVKSRFCKENQSFSTKLNYLVLFLLESKDHLFTTYHLNVSECGGAYHLNNGQHLEVSSPSNKLGTYPLYSYCEWRLSAANSINLTVSVMFIDLEDCTYSMYDFVKIYEGIGVHKKLKTALCKKPSNRISITGSATIVFRSDGSTSKSGFRMLVTSTEGKQTTSFSSI